jgi:hypothetical protein
MIESWNPENSVGWTRDGSRSAWIDAELPEHVGGVLAQGGH